MCAREMEFKSILFSLCYFHAVVSERRKFGPQGWNRKYPFNTGDLTISVSVLYNYLEANTKVPWEDLRYLFGEIMYGGHITDDWDRRLCRTYLEEYMNPLMVCCSVFDVCAFTDNNKNIIGETFSDILVIRLSCLVFFFVGFLFDSWRIKISLLSSSSLSTFKRHLKTYLFVTSY